MKKLFAMAVLLFSFATMASQTYVPPPPPKLPEILSEEMVRKGKHLFEDNYWIDGRLEIHNILGERSCASCHDQEDKLEPAELARDFKNIRSKINKQIQTKALGEPLPNESPMMEALVQYLVRRYKLQEFKLPK